jgi:hypothetical protein
VEYGRGLTRHGDGSISPHAAVIARVNRILLSCFSVCSRPKRSRTNPCEHHNNSTNPEQYASRTSQTRSRAKEGNCESQNRASNGSSKYPLASTLFLPQQSDEVFVRHQIFLLFSFLLDLIDDWRHNIRGLGASNRLVVGGPVAGSYRHTMAALLVAGLPISSEASAVEPGLHPSLMTRAKSAPRRTGEGGL